MLSGPAAKLRDRRLRKRLLFVLSLCLDSPKGGMNGRPLVMNVNEDVIDELAFEDDAHAMRLIRELVNKGLIAEERLTQRKFERFGPEFVFLRITDRGSMLLREEIPVDPDVDDERITI